MPKKTVKKKQYGNNRPLSKLQKHILELCEKQDTVNYNDILVSYYRFKPVRPWCKKYMFSKGKEISAARVSICKSINRLVDRGLIDRVYYCLISLSYKAGR